jgi:dTDP-glucose pyrophosphorylase
MKAIIPMAGFGTRMGMLPNEAKELLLIDGKYLIEYSLEICEKYKLEPIFIVRKEKQQLIEYLKGNKFDPLIVGPGQEWAQTVLKSQDLWDDKGNILLLPDTRFGPTSIINDMKKSLEFGSEIVFAIHKVEDVSKWGFVTNACYAEKPPLIAQGYAWGLIGFTKKAGISLFTNMQIKSYNAHDFSTNFLFLDSFKDVTR